MLIQDHANLRENRSGFWTEKLYSESGKCSFLVYHERMAEISDSISNAKQRLRHLKTLSNVDTDKFMKAMYCFHPDFFR